MQHEESRNEKVLLSNSANCIKLMSLSRTCNSTERTLQPSVIKIESHPPGLEQNILQNLPSGDSSSIKKGTLKLDHASQFSSPANVIPQNSGTVNVITNASNNSIYIQPKMLKNTLVKQSSSNQREVKNVIVYQPVSVAAYNRSVQSNVPDYSVKLSFLPVSSIKNSQSHTLLYVNNQVRSAVLSGPSINSKSSSAAVPDIKSPVLLLPSQKGGKTVKIRLKPLQKLKTNSDAKTTAESNPNSKCSKDITSGNTVKAFKNPSMLLKVLGPCLKNLITHEPESIPFLQPVDIKEAPDYYDIIKSPMDLSTIAKKLNTGQYEDAWQFIDDVWLMFNNAWLYNNKKHPVYLNCTKLAESFKEIIDSRMRSLGYCCGQYYEFEPHILYCQSKDNCVIAKYGKYWSYRDKYKFCNKCVTLSKGAITLSNNLGESHLIYVNQLTEKINNVTRKEEFVKCIYCGIKIHKICGSHVDIIWKEGYICGACIKEFGRKRVLPQQFSYKSLQKTKLGSHIEMRVNNFLKTKGCDAGVAVRVVYQGRKEFFVADSLKSRYVDTAIWPEKFPYTAKSILVFQEKINVCFFAMFVQEYDSNCHPPNSRRVYISYLDSVHYFTPKHLRTEVYHEILLGYLDFVRRLGYEAVHLWSCPPPNANDDYIFYRHPKEQKVPNTKRLNEWYQKMLTKAITEKIISNYKDIFEQACEDKIQDACQLPYFDGDFFPSILEKEIAKNDCDECSKSSQSNTFENNEQNIKSEPRKEKLTKFKKGKRCVKKAKTSSCQYTDDAVTNRLYQLMQEHRKSFLVINLRTPKDALGKHIHDPDPSIPSSIMDTRDSFLTLAKDQNLDFSSLRRAKYSTLALVYNLHKDSMGSYSCNHCHSDFLKGFHCLVCDDFDLCCDCYTKKGHNQKHKMEEINQDFQFYAKFPIQPKSTKGHPIAIYLSILHHVSQCLNTNCNISNCGTFRRVQEHSKVCKIKFPQCRICLYYSHLTYRHFMICKFENCQILMCKYLKAIKRKMQILLRSNENKRTNNILEKCLGSSESDIPKKIGDLASAFVKSISLRTSRNVSAHGTQKLPPNNSSSQVYMQNKNSATVTNSEKNKYVELMENIHNKKPVFFQPVQNNNSQNKNNCAIIMSEKTKTQGQNFDGLNSVSESVAVNSFGGIIKIPLKSCDNSNDIHDTYHKLEFQSSNIQTVTAESQSVLYTPLNTEAQDMYHYPDSPKNYQHAPLHDFQLQNQQTISSCALNSDENCMSNSDIQMNQYSVPPTSQHENKSSYFNDYLSAPVYPISTQFSNSENISTLSNCTETPYMHNQLSDVSASCESPLNVYTLEENQKLTATCINYDNFSSNTKTPYSAVHHLHNTISYPSKSFQNLEPSSAAFDDSQSKMQIDPDSFFTNSDTKTPDLSSAQLNNYTSLTETMNINAITKNLDNVNYCNVQFSQMPLDSGDILMDYEDGVTTSDGSSVTQYSF